MHALQLAIQSEQQDPQWRQFCPQQEQEQSYEWKQGAGGEGSWSANSSVEVRPNISSPTSTDLASLSHASPAALPAPDGQEMGSHSDTFLHLPVLVSSSDEKASEVDVNGLTLPARPVTHEFSINALAP